MTASDIGDPEAIDEAEIVIEEAEIVNDEAEITVRHERKHQKLMAIFRKVDHLVVMNRLKERCIQFKMNRLKDR